MPRALTALTLIGLAALMAWPWLDPPHAGQDLVLELRPGRRTAIPDSSVSVTWHPPGAVTTMRSAHGRGYPGYTERFVVEGAAGWRRELTGTELIRARLGPWHVLHAGSRADLGHFSAHEPGLFDQLFGWLLGGDADTGVLVLTQDPTRAASPVVPKIP